MSTVDPDARMRRTGQSLKFLFWPSIVIGVLCGPIIATLEVAEPGIPLGVLFILFIFLSVGLGLVAYYLPSKRSPLAMAAYIVAYAASVFWVLCAAPGQGPTSLGEYVGFVVFLVVIYAVALLLLGLYIRRHLATIATQAHGVDTTATIMSASLNGRVNYVAHYRLTLKFEDNTGVTRYLRIGRTGGNPQPGETLPLRYDPEHPGSKHRIVVGY